MAKTLVQLISEVLIVLGQHFYLTAHCQQCTLGGRERE